MNGGQICRLMVVGKATRNMGVMFTPENLTIFACTARAKNTNNSIRAIIKTANDWGAAPLVLRYASAAAPNPGKIK